MRSLILAFVALPMFSLAQADGDAKFVVTGAVKGLADNSKVFLADVSNPTDTVAASTVKGGQFVLSGHITEPNLYELNFGGTGKKVPLFMGNDKISMDGTIDDPRTIVAKGSVTNDDFVEFQKTFTPYFVRMNGLTQSANSSGGARDSVYKVYKLLVDTVEHNVDQFIEHKKSSYVSPFVLVVLNQVTDDAFLQEKRLLSLTPDVQKGYYGQYLGKQIADAKVGAVGSEALDFTQNDTAGRAVALSSFKGKYVLLDFWASWCGPCRMDNPNVVNTYKKFKDKNFTILSVSLDKTREPWIKAINADGLTWTHVSDLKYWYNEVAVKYHVQAIPQNLLIDPNGKIVGKNLHGADLQAKLCELLGCN